MADKYTFDIKEKAKNKYTIEAKVSKEMQDEVSEKFFKTRSAKVKLPGFRPGKAPKELLEKEVAADVLNDTLNDLLPQVATEIVVEKNLNPISRLDYEVKEFTKDGELVFTFTFYASPEIELNKLKKIKVASEEVKIEDAEIDSVIRSIIKSSLPEEKWNKNAKKDDKKEEGSGEDIKFDVTDELVKELGYEDETTLEGMKKRVRETLENVKKTDAENKYANDVLDEAIKIIEFDIPEELIHDELHRREHDFVDRLKKIKLDPESYLKTQGKSFDDLKKDWEQDIKKGASRDIIGISIATQEKLIPSEEEVDEEIEKIEDKIVQVQYKSQTRLRDQLRTIMARNRGIQKMIDMTR